MAISFRMGEALQTTTGGGFITCNPGTDPVSGDVLIAVMGEATDLADPTGASMSNDSFGGTWTTEHQENWGTRRELFVSVNDDWTTATGSVRINESGNNNQDAYGGMAIVEGGDGGYTEDVVVTSSSGTSWAPSLTGSHDGHIAVIQHETQETISTPSGWSLLDRIDDADGLRSLHIFTFVGSVTSVTFSFSSSGFSAWSAYFDAAASAGGIVVPRRSATRRHLLTR